MNFYDDLVMQTQMNYSRHYPIYASGSTPYQLTDKKPLPYSEQIHRLVQEVKEADCVVVGGASGLSAAGGGDFYYEDNDSYRKYFRPFAEKYHFKGAFAGMMHPWKTREEYWGYLATFLHTTQTAPVRHSYLDLDALLKGKDFFILTTNQDTQFVKLYPEEKVAEIQGDHRFFQCAACCTDDTWDAVKPVADMVAAMGDGTKIPTDLIPRCPHCGGEAFPWVRGYGNFLQGKKYEEQYEKIVEKCASKIQNLEDLINGNFPDDLKSLFTEKRAGLFPSMAKIHFNCSCPDWADMCKHVAAVLYGIGSRFDKDPLLFFKLRGVDTERLIGNAINDRIESMIENASKPSDRIMDDADLTALFGMEV